jgi:hypothetical protein
VKKREYHGHAGKHQVSVEYQTWQRMLKRCHDSKDKNYADYGGRGISVCHAWRMSFRKFFAHVGVRPGPGYTIERIENNKGYAPGNVRWATRAEQSRNRRANIMITRGGETLALVDWVKRTNLKYVTVLERLYLGWTPERALTTPARPRRPEHKLTAAEVRKIRALYATGKYTQVQLAKMFGTSNHSRISSIVLRRTWKAVS